MPQSPLQELAQGVLKRLGMNPKPPLSRFNTSINVNAPMLNDPFPDNLDEIILGNKTSRPSGAFLGNGKINSIPNINLRRKGFGFIKGGQVNGVDKLNAALKELLKEYPYANNIPTGIYPSNDIDDIGEGLYNNKDNVIGISTNNLKYKDTLDLAGFLAHELTHAVQRNNFIDKKDYDNAWSYPQPYNINPIETQPFGVEDRVTEKLYNKAGKRY